MELAGLSDKRAYLAVLGSLIQNPILISDVDKPLSKADFDTEKFYQIIYVTIYNLYNQGVEKIDEFAIDSYLVNFPEQYEIFNSNDGLKWVSDAMDMAMTCNYDYYYHRLRKYSLLRYYEKSGFDTRTIFNPNTVDNSVEQQKFDEYTEQQIIDIIENKLVVEPKTNFCNGYAVVNAQAGEGLAQMVEELREIPDYGFSLSSMAVNTVARGLRKGKLYMRSAATGSGKTRYFLMDACCLAVPYTYNLDKNEFEYTGHCTPTLYIGCEGSIEEFMSIILACVSGIDEEAIITGNYNDEEYERIKQATKYIEDSPLYLVYTDEYTIADIENIVKKYVIQKGIEAVIYDYIQTTAKMMGDITSSTRVKLQEYQVLVQFAGRLKALAEQLNIAILTGSQLRPDAKDQKYKDETCLQGAKGMAQKADCGFVITRPTKGEKEKIAKLTKNMWNTPDVNLLLWVYKVRRGKLVSIIIHQHISLGTMRVKDLFVTDYDFNLIDIDFTKIEEVDNVIKEKSRQMKVDDKEEIEDEDEVEEEKPNTKFDW